MTKNAHPRLFLAAIVFAPIAAGTAAPVIAQDVAPETPAELRDFKLNPEKAPPVRQPLPTTDVVTKPPAATVPVIEIPSVRIPAARTPAERKPATVKSAAAPPPRTSAPVVIAKPTIAAAPVLDDAAPDIAVPQNELPAEDILPSAAVPPDTASVTPEFAADAAPAPALPWGYILAAVFVAIGAVITLVLKRRRRVGAGVSETMSETVFAPGQDVADGHQIIQPDPVAQLAAAPMIPMPTLASALAATNRPKLEVSFVPEKASISLANLTIKGRLHIVNNGAQDAAAMQLNAAVISASEGQNETISRYFSSVLAEGKDLGAAKVGEQIALEMDLMIPIADLQTFSVAEQKLLVPIILARVEYQWGDSAQADGMLYDEAQLSCLIGREATPPKPKMGALRLDLGPRNFASLGQRPVFG